MKILFAVKIGDADWQEVLITEHEDRIPAAKEWATKNGFDRFRELDMPSDVDVLDLFGSSVKL